jgi:hemoglobin-like flavoprotein
VWITNLQTILELKIGDITMGLNVELLKESFENVKPIAGEVADKFYEILFEDYPGSDGLFANVDMPTQKKLLINSLVYVVEHLEDSQALGKYLMNMGGRHTDYGTQEEHYDWVGLSLLKTFAHFFGDGWTEELNGAWAEAYSVIASVMKQGAQERLASESDEENSQPSESPVEEDDNVVHLNKGSQVSENSSIQINLTDEIKDQIRFAVRESI